MTPRLAKGRFVFPKKRGIAGKAHFMQTDITALCGRQVTAGKIMESDWNPEEHKENVCKKCLEWYRIIARNPPKPL